jgi:tellurite resistance protein TehA-like permease
MGAHTWGAGGGHGRCVRNLPPAYFALVMATGIVSIAALGFDLPLFAKTLFVVNVLAYAFLSVLTLLRAAIYPRLLFGDMVDHRAGPGFFTAVAGSCLIGAQFLLIERSVVAAASFLTVGVALWTGVTYTIFTALTIKRDKPSLKDGLSSLWLVAVVATQSIAILAALLAREWPAPGRTEFDFFALTMWLWGGMFYIWIIVLIFYRYTYFSYSANDFDPPSWINMGAMAISTLAGLNLAQNAPDAPFLAAILPFLKGLTLLYWATGTWWIPMLLVLTAWRQFVVRVPLRYDPTYWGAVFPLGMYSDATRQMATAFDLPFLDFVARTVFIAAVGAWAFAFAGLFWDLRKALTSPES